MLYQATNSVVGHYLLQYLCEMVLIHPHWKKRTGTNWKMHPPSLPHHRSSKDDVRRRFSLQGVVQCKMLPGFGRKSSTICSKRFISVCHALTLHQQPRHWKCTKLHPPGATTPSWAWFHSGICGGLCFRRGSWGGGRGCHWSSCWRGGWSSHWRSYWHSCRGSWRRHRSSCWGSHWSDWRDHSGRRRWFPQQSIHCMTKHERRSTR